jgi:hypothetical protein
MLHNILRRKQIYDTEEMYDTDKFVTIGFMSTHKAI